MEYVCIQCGQDHPGALTFHHRDPSKKLIGIADMVANRASKKKIIAEIEKCDCLCANCHNILHWEEKSEYQKILAERCGVH